MAIKYQVLKPSQRGESNYTIDVKLIAEGGYSECQKYVIPAVASEDSFLSSLATDFDTKYQASVATVTPETPEAEKVAE